MLSYQVLFDYFKEERGHLIQAFEGLSYEEFVRPRGLSFGSIKDVFVHTIIVEDVWLHYRPNGVTMSSQIKREDIKNLQDVKRYVAEVDAKTVMLFQQLTDQELKREFKVIRPRPGGRESVERLGVILYHVPIEVIHHYGEIFAEFWKMGIDAPYYAYPRYLRDKIPESKLAR
jgi:uncharacterized damage-inducible protein DinB